MLSEYFRNFDFYSPVRTTILLPLAILVGCIDNTKLENNSLLDSGEILDFNSTDQPNENESNVLFSVDTTFGQISQIDPSNGYTIPIESVSMEHQVSSMTFNEDGTAYVYDHVNRKIGVLEPFSGELNLLPTSNEDHVICGISFASNGLLYGLDSKNNQLVTYDLETGEASSIGPLNMNIRACDWCDCFYGRSISYRYRNRHNIQPLVHECSF
jgi:hypothetical protein